MLLFRHHYNSSSHSCLMSPALWEVAVSAFQYWNCLSNHAKEFYIWLKGYWKGHDRNWVLCCKEKEVHINRRYFLPCASWYQYKNIQYKSHKWCLVSQGLGEFHKTWFVMNTVYITRRKEDCINFPPFFFLCCWIPNLGFCACVLARTLDYWAAF